LKPADTGEYKVTITLQDDKFQESFKKTVEFFNLNIKVHPKPNDTEPVANDTVSLTSEAT
jgi:hypothetical protein